MKYFILVLMLFFTLPIYSQTDPEANSLLLLERGSLSRINNSSKKATQKIKECESALLGFYSVIKKYEDNMYQYTSNVQSVISQSTDVVAIGTRLKDIVTNSTKVLKELKNVQGFSVVALKSKIPLEVTRKTIDVTMILNKVALQSKSELLNSQERAILLMRCKYELDILNGLLLQLTFQLKNFKLAKDVFLFNFEDVFVDPREQVVNSVIRNFKSI